MTVPVALIAAVAENGVIGAAGQIPWRLPTDFAFFRRMTLGKPLIMGRRTFESIGRPLPGRTSIIVSRRPGYQAEGAVIVDSLPLALDRAQAIAAADHAEEVMVGGGAEIYREALPLADRIYLTEVELSPLGDASFPHLDTAMWDVEDLPEVVPGPRDSAGFRVKIYRRRAVSAR